MTTPLDDMFGGFNDDMDPNAGVNNRPDLGRGLYVLSKYYPKSTTKKGNILVAELLVVTPPPGGEKKPGEMVSVAWFVSDSDMVKRRYEKARAAGFVRALLGLPDKDPNTKQAFDTGPYAAKLCAQHQPGTGRLLTINTEPNGQYRNYRYEHVPNQTPESVKAMRDRVVSAMSFTPGQSTQAAAPANPAPAPAAPPPAAVDPLAALFGGAGGGNPGNTGGFGSGGDIPF
jgi:hypothetical protein